MGVPQYPRNLATEWNQMKREVKSAFTTGNLRTGMAKIGARVIEITGELVLNAGAKLVTKYENGNTAFEVGRFYLTSGETAQGFYFKRPDGSLSLWGYSTDNGSGWLGLYDRMGNIIISDDGASGKGLARPWLTYNVQRTKEVIDPSDKVTTGTWTPVQTIAGRAQHPKIYVYGLFQVFDSDTAQWRLKDTDTGEILYTNPISTAVWAGCTVNHPDYFFDKEFKYDIEVRRASGTGRGAGYTPTIVMGRQT